MTDLPVYDVIALSLPAAEKATGLPRQLIRARAWWGDFDLHHAGHRRGKALIRAATLFRWAPAWEAYREAHDDGGHRWAERFIFDPVEQPPVYSFISCGLDDAADRTGVSTATLRLAIRNGDLVPRYAGEKQGKLLFRAADLDAWVLSLPTERYRE
ncbi:helix-turn-helix transcriptional regulator [Georgenia sp. AZ-5]|uniref:helix-turn-helix transcriptional regulator n=1 Tax=Georgenia sp. AZ-5 TaxID=3367526 RepID=UPI0037540BA6